MASVQQVFDMRLHSQRYRSWVLFLCFLMMASNYIDRSILTILAQPIKVEFRLSDMQIGALGGLAFAALYIVAGFPLARIAETRNRVTIISVSIAVWSAMTALCGLAQSYIQLLLFRVGVGIGEAGASPAAQSLLADYYPPARRASALSVFALGGPVGGLVGAMIAGAIAQAYGWRTAFIVMGVPGLVLAITFKVTATEPHRGCQDSQHGSSANIEAAPPSLWAVTCYLFRCSTFVQMVVGAAIANFALQGIFQFTAASFVRNFGIGLREVGLLMGLLGGVCGGFGTVLGGFGADWAAQFDRRWYAWLPAISLIACAPLYAWGYLQPSWTSASAMLALAAVLSYVFIAPLLSVTQNLAQVRMRATAVALMTLVTASVGVATGPLVVGWLSDVLAAQSFASAAAGSFATVCPGGLASPDASQVVRSACRAASAQGVQHALVAASAMFIWAGVHFYLASRSIRRDLAVALES